MVQRLKTYNRHVQDRGGQGAGDREKRGREGYGRRERKGREEGVPKGREAGEIGENYVTLHNISQSKKGKMEEAKKKGAGGGRFGPPRPPPKDTGILYYAVCFVVNT